MKRFLPLLAAVAVCSSAAAGYSQALPTASTRGLLQVGGAYVADFPDYTRHKFYGYGFYADFDFSEHFGLELEYKHASDSLLPQSEHTYTAGVRYDRQYANFNPYVKVEVGHGTIEFPPFPAPAPDTSAGSLGDYLVGAGAGVDYAFSQHLSLRAALEYQRWSATTTSTSSSPNDINGLPRGLTPIFYTGGIAYRFGNGNIIRSRYEH